MNHGEEFYEGLEARYDVREKLDLARKLVSQRNEIRGRLRPMESFILPSDESLDPSEEKQSHKTKKKKSGSVTASDFETIEMTSFEPVI